MTDSFTYWRKRHGDREEAYLADRYCGLSMRIHGYPDQVEFFVDCFAMTTDRYPLAGEPASGPSVVRKGNHPIPGQTTIFEQGA